MNKNKPKKILMLLTEDWFFVSHFLERAIALKKEGFFVIVCSKKNEHKSFIEKKGFKFIEVPFDRKSLNLIKELNIILKIFKIYFKERPDIVHHVTFKPIIYGSFVSRILKIKNIINAPVGMGYIYSSKDFKAKILKPILNSLYVLFLCSDKRKSGNNKVIFENQNDQMEFIKMGALNYKQSVLIRGAGVDFKYYKTFHKYKKKENSIPVISLVCRMVKDKGVYEFVAAAKIILKQGIKAKFLLVGDVDPFNPSSITTETLKDWNNSPNIEWSGWIKNIPEILVKTDILCLPSYREGLPKSLVEGAAMKLPIVTTDTVGCRDIVIDGENGFLVPVRNIDKLSLALKKLIVDKKLRINMGEKGFDYAIKRFSSEIIIKKTLNVYKNI